METIEERERKENEGARISMRELENFLLRDERKHLPWDAEPHTGLVATIEAYIKFLEERVNVLRSSLDNRDGTLAGVRKERDEAEKQNRINQDSILKIMEFLGSKDRKPMQSVDRWSSPEKSVIEYVLFLEKEWDEAMKRERDFGRASVNLKQNEAIPDPTYTFTVSSSHIRDILEIFRNAFKS